MTQLLTLQHNILICSMFWNIDLLTLKYLLLPNEVVFLWSFTLKLVALKHSVKNLRNKLNLAFPFWMWSLNTLLKISLGAIDSKMRPIQSVQWLGCFLVLTLFLGALGQNITNEEDLPKNGTKLGKGKKSVWEILECVKNSQVSCLEIYASLFRTPTCRKSIKTINLS